MARNAFISWWKMFVRLESVFENAPDDCAGKALKASFVYARTGEVPELDQVSLILFSAIRPSIDDSAETFENISKRNRENGKNGGRPPKKSSTHELAETQNNPENPNNPEKTEDRSKKKEVRSEKIEDRERKADKPPRARFQPPTEAEAIAYFAEQGSSEKGGQKLYRLLYSQGLEDRRKSPDEELEGSRPQLDTQKRRVWRQQANRKTDTDHYTGKYYRWFRMTDNRKKPPRMLEHPERQAVKSD